MRGKIGAGRIRLIDKGIADAVSAELPVLSSRGHMIVNIGGDTTEISVIASGKIILSQTLKIGGRRLDEDISTMVRRKFNLSIGQQSAEALKNNLAFMTNGPRAGAEGVRYSYAVRPSEVGYDSVAGGECSDH